MANKFANPGVPDRSNPGADEEGLGMNPSDKCPR